MNKKNFDSDGKNFFSNCFSSTPGDNISRLPVSAMDDVRAVYLCHDVAVLN